jgi:SAM-dependent methyltransferase
LGHGDPPALYDSPSLYDLPSLYDRVVPPGPCEAFYRDVAAHAGDPILELACGTGRLAVPLAADGHEVVGLDASPSMLGAARAKAEANGVELDLVQGDMRDFDLGRRFALVIVSCNSLAHLVRNEDLASCLAAVARHLAPGGVFAFDVVNPSLRELAGSESSGAPTGAREHLLSVAGNVRSIAYDPVRQVQELQLRVLEPGMEKLVIAPMHLRIFFPQEVPPRLALAGMEMAACYGDFDGDWLTGRSSNQVCLARSMGASPPRGQARTSRSI